MAKKITKHGAEHIRAEISRLNSELLNSKNLYRVDQEDTEDLGFKYNPVGVEVEARREAIQKQIAGYRNELEDAQIVEDMPTEENMVGLHDVVELSCDYGDETVVIVAYIKEMDIEENLPGVSNITILSPIGRAVFNHLVGETVTAVLPNKSTCKVTINSIEKALKR